MKTKDKIKRGSNAAGHRKYRRRLGIENTVVTTVPQEPSLDDVHPIGTERRIRSEDYGKSYNGEKGTVTGYEDSKVLLQVRPAKRKTPLTINPDHLEVI